MAPKLDRLAPIFGMVAKLFAKATTKFGLATTIAALWLTVVPITGAVAEAPLSGSSLEAEAPWNGSGSSLERFRVSHFWVMVGPPAYHPFVRQLVTAKQMSVGDSARLMALATSASCCAIPTCRNSHKCGPRAPAHPAAQTRATIHRRRCRKRRISRGTRCSPPMRGWRRSAG